MCLNTVDKKKPTKKEGIGWKVFTAYNPRHGLYFVTVGGYAPINTWLQAKGHKIGYGDYRKRLTYPAGFHVFTSRRGAERYLNYQGGSTNYRLKIFQVQYREAVASGQQYQMKVIIARQIKIKPLAQ